MSGRGRTGALLLEVLLALAIMVPAGLAILALVGQSGDTLIAARERMIAADLANSAMAKIEAGVETIETLDGPVKPWEGEGAAGFADAPPPDQEWELQIESEPSPFAGLVRVSVVAIKNTGGTARRLASCHRLVRLGRSGDGRATEWPAGGTR
ncbi:MAG: hypothetical protein KF745_10040 [Phycisphaeraceae bacterium]|nr:hypothetical protein [Phycisphaeraceae bacterium]